MLFRRPLSSTLLKINTWPAGALYRKVIHNMLELNEKFALSVLEPNDDRTRKAIFDLVRADWALEGSYG